VESLPKMGGVYFFSDLKGTDTTSTSPLDCSDNGIAALMETLELHDLGFVLHDKKNCFNELQIEYLLQSLQPTLESSGKDGYPNASVPGIYSGQQRGRKSKNSTWVVIPCLRVLLFTSNLYRGFTIMVVNKTL
jgi:hypothetical protein